MGARRKKRTANSDESVSGHIIKEVGIDKDWAAWRHGSDLPDRLESRKAMMKEDREECKRDYCSLAATK